jgi:deoxyribodipyrimidine photo-lyase
MSATLVWLRQDLRLVDHRALQAAVVRGEPLAICYVLDDLTPGPWAQGAASRWWLHHSLAALAADIEALGGQLIIRRGPFARELAALSQQLGVDQLLCSRSYEPWAAELEQQLHPLLHDQGVAFKRFAGTLLQEPENISNGSGLPYKVFTPFWKACLREAAPDQPLPAPDSLHFIEQTVASVALSKLNLLPQEPDWAAHWPRHWQPGERGAQQSLQRFLDGGLADYAQDRNFPARQSISRLSAHLHFGELSPRSLWHAVNNLKQQQPQLEEQLDKFLSELGWREFSHHLLHHFPHIPEEAFKAEFQQFPWLGNPEHLVAWQQGNTGYPIVDAGMRELWQTGYMHNRVRMVVASFLTKHLMLPWRLGADWFWDTLVDADLANNACGWQWVAGSGADAAPYFRIFNPTLQGEKFDREGDYVRKWVPELSALPDKYLHQPEQAPANVLDAAAVELGVTYPLPIVDHRQARASALAAYGSLREGLA